MPAIRTINTLTRIHPEPKPTEGCARVTIPAMNFIGAKVWPTRKCLGVPVAEITRGRTLRIRLSAPIVGLTGSVRERDLTRRLEPPQRLLNCASSARLQDVLKFRRLSLLGLMDNLPNVYRRRSVVVAISNSPKPNFPIRFDGHDWKGARMNPPFGSLLRHE